MMSFTTYRSITYINVRNGASSSFWSDHWLAAGPLCTTHAALFSHTLMPNISVQTVFHAESDLCLRPNPCSGSTIGQLTYLFAGNQPPWWPWRATPQDQRQSLHHQGRVCCLDHQLESPVVHGRHSKGTRLTNKVKNFAWLYFKDRLSLRANLFANHMLEDNIFRLCSNCVQDGKHIFLKCSSSSKLCGILRLCHVEEIMDMDTGTARTPLHLDAKLWPFIWLTLLWRIWDARNAEVFRSEPFSVDVY